MSSSVLACCRFVPRWLWTLIVFLVTCPSLWPQSLVGTGSQPFAIAVDPATNKIYVANRQGTVTVIDGATNGTQSVTVGSAPVAIAVNTVTKKAYVACSGGTVWVITEGEDGTFRGSRIISAGLNPQAIIVNPVTNKIYVATAGSNLLTSPQNGNVSVIDGTNDTLRTTFPVGINPFALALNPVTNHVYVANNSNGSNATVSVIDGSIDTVVGSIGVGNSPNALAVNPVTNKVYVIDGNGLDVIDGATNAIRTTTPLTNSNLTAIAVNPVTNSIYITAILPTGTLIAIDGANDRLSGIALIGNYPPALAVNSLTNLIYVTDNSTSGRVFVIDGSTNNRVDSFLTGNSPGAVAVNPVTNRVYVANYVDNTVAVVDGATKTTITIDAGSNPNAVAVNQLTNQVYVPNLDGQNVTVIDAANGNITHSVNTGTNPTAVAVNPATNKVYVANHGSANVTVIDGLNVDAPPTTVSAGQVPFAVAVNTVTNKAYVTNSGDGTVTVIDGTTNGTSNIPVGTTPQGLAINEATNTIVVANQGDNTVTVINGDTNATTTVPVGSRPVAVGVNATENNFYVVNQGSDDVTVIDGDELEPIDLIRVRNTPGAVAVNPLTNRIYVVNHFSDSVSVIDGASGNIIRPPVTTGSLPNALDLNLLTNKIYVSNQSDNTVSVIDGAGDTVSATLQTGTVPSGVAVNPVTNKVYVSNASSGDVTEITVGVQQPVPLTIALTPVVTGSDTFTSGGVFSTFNETPSFKVTVTSAYDSSPPYTNYVGTVTDPPPTQVYFSADGVTPWSVATPTDPGGSNPAHFTITLSPQDSGLHTLYVFAAYGNGVGHNTSATGTGNSPEISNLQRVPLLVLPNATTTALVSDAPNGAEGGATIVFTATVTEGGSPVTEGLVQFFIDGKTQDNPIPVDSNGVATYTNNKLSPGSHTIQAVYLGTDKFVESSASLTQIVYGSPASITVSSGNNQSAAVNTNYASPLVAVVKDEVGDPVPNITVTWATNGTTTTPGGTLSAATSITDANGLASVNVTANSKTGSFQVTASAVEPPAQFTLTNTAGAPTSITINGESSPQTAVINSPFATPLTVLVTDAGGNPVQGVTVTYVANGTTANASLSVPSALTDVDGFAHVIATANGIAGGPYTVTASAGSVGSANFALTNSTIGTTTSLTTTTPTVIYGNTITLIASVNQSLATGKVTFSDGTTELGTATLSAGSSTLTLNQLPGGQYLPVGAYSITASYAGDNNFAGSSSGPAQVTVTKRTAAGGGPALTVEANSVTRQFGQPNAFGYTVVGALVPGDTTVSAVTGTAVYTTSATLTSLVGTYPVSVSGLVSANYEIAFQDGTVTVTQGNSTTTIATASTTIMYGDQEVLTAAVTQGATGTVSFYEGSTLLGTASLDSATRAELPISTLPAGVHTITATFNGGPNLLPSTSSPATLTVTQRATGEDQSPALTIVVRNATRPANGELAIFTYYVTGQLFNNDTYETAITGTPQLASPAGSDPGTYPITISGLTSNNYTLTSVPGTLIVTDDAIGKPSTTTLTVNPSSGQYGDPITLTATMSPTVASGRVTFYDVLPSGGTVFIGDATLSGGTATFVASTLNAGTHSVEAAYSGDGIYSTSISPPMTVTVAKKQGAGGGAALTITVQNASRQLGTANPQFAFIVTGVTGILVPGDSFESAVTGVAVYTTTDTSSSAVGTTYPITVSGLVSQNYEIATVDGTLTIVAASSTTTLIAAQTTGFTAAQYGDTVTLTATVAPTTATGTVVFLEGQNVLGTASVGSGTGVATLAITTLQAGRHTITATYLGDSNLGASTSTPVTIVVSQKTGPNGEPYLVVAPNNTSRIYGQANPAFTYSVSGAFLNGDTPATAVKGVPIYSTPASLGSPAGTYPVSIVGGLSSLNYLLEFQDGTFAVTPTSLTVALTSSLNPATYGVIIPVIFTATLPADATGTVTFLDGATTFGTGTITGGVATQPTNSLTAGTHSITAQYGGDSNYNAAVSTALSQVVNKATPTVALTSSLNPSTFGTSVNFRVALPTDATGTVTFLDGTTVLGTGTIGTGVATLTTSSLGVGTHSITAQYGGDSNYNDAVSTAVSQVVNLASSTVALASSLNPSTFGASVTLTATVTSGATGTVTFHDGTTSLGSGTISSGVATLTTSSLAAGTHSITAQYGGDSNYNGTTSSVTQVVNKATLTVTANDASRPYGTADPAFTSTITGFVNGDTQASVVTGSPSLTTTATTISPAGTYPITAALGTLATNNNYIFAFINGTLTVTEATGASTTLSVSPTTVTYGDPAVLTAVVGPPSGATGTVSFYEGTTPLGAASLNSSGTAVLPVSTLNTGTHTITATYNGDVNFPASSSNPVTLTVTQRTGADGAALTVTVNDASRTTTEANPPFSHTVAGDLVNGDTYATAVTGTPTYSTTAGTTAGTFAITVSGLTSQNYVLAFVPGTLTVVPTSSTTTLATSPNSSQYGDPVTLTATVTSDATGTASFYNSSVYLGQGTVTGGVATLSTTTLNAGTHTITATYNGDATYASSKSEPATVTVAKKTAAGGGPALTVTVLNESREYGTANPEFSYIVSGTLLNGDTYETAVTGVPIYTLTDSPNSPAGSTFPINVSGLVSQNYTLTTVPGTLTIVTAPTTTALAIMSPTTTTVQTTSVTSQYGDPATLTATVAPTSATGTVVFSNGSTVVGTATVSGGTATFTGSTLSVGTKTVTTSYQGDANHAASTSSPVTAIVTPRTGPDGGAALTVTVTNASRQYGQGNPAFSYTVTGTLVNGDTYATAVTGVPVFSTTATVTSPVGTYPISITGGLSSPNYSIAFVNGTLTVSKGTPSVTVASSQNPSAPATSVTFTATLSAGASGTVTFMDGTTVMGIGTVSSGTASFSTSTLSVGTHSITAAYSGDGNYNGVTSPAFPQVVNKTATTVTVASSRNPVPLGSSVAFTATVSAGATGTVQFLDGTTVLGAGTVSSGTASFSTATLSVGTHSITAVYSGDATYNGATSSAVSQVVQTVGPPPTFTVASTTGPQLIPPGASASYSITVTPVNGAFNNVVTLTATNLPPGSSYTFAPTALTPGSAGATSTFTVSVPKQSAALRRVSKTPFVLAVLLLPLALLRRTRARPPRLLLWLLLGLTSFGAISGCGAGGYFNQPQQTYTITIIATSGNVANSSTVTLTVQ